MTAAISRIGAATRVFGIVADPIAHVRTPQLFNELAAAHGIDAAMVPMHVAPEDLVAFMRGLRGWRNFGGLIATVPHKTAMPALCDTLTERARMADAVNAVRRERDGSLAGDLLDGEGFVGGLRARAIEPRGMDVWMAGAGGAASAIAFALIEAGAARLSIYNRTLARAAALAARLTAAFPVARIEVTEAPPQSCDLIVNATSLGMHDGDPLPVDAAALRPGMIVAEIIMSPATTPLLAAAARRGCRIHPGLPMLEAQIEAMARFMGAVP